MQKLIIVDDKAPSTSTIAHSLKWDIEEITNGDCGVELLEGVIIVDALPQIKTKVRDLSKAGHMVVGLLFDLVDETRKVADAGAILLDKVKADPKLSPIPVVLYTSRFVPVDVPALRARGAHALVRRKVTGGHAAALGAQVLDAFGIPHN